MKEAKYIETYKGHDYYRDAYGNIYTKIGEQVVFCSNHKDGHLTENKAEPFYSVNDIELIKCQ